jgi:hypothetical protein
MLHICVKWYYCLKFYWCPFQPFQPAPTSVPPLAGWMSNPPAVTHPAVSGGAIGFGTPTNPGTYVNTCSVLLII